MLLKEKKHHLFLLKAAQNNVSTPHRIKQYIAVLWYSRGNISICYRCNSNTNRWVLLSLLLSSSSQLLWAVLNTDSWLHTAFCNSVFQNRPVVTISGTAHLNLLLLLILLPFTSQLVQYWHILYHFTFTKLKFTISYA